MKVGDTVYIITNNRNIEEATLKRISGNLCLIRFKSGGGIQLPKGRLFETREQAQEHINKHSIAPVNNKEQIKHQRNRSTTDCYSRNAQIL